MIKWLVNLCKKSKPDFYWFKCGSCSNVSKQVMPPRKLEFSFHDGKRYKSIMDGCESCYLKAASTSMERQYAKNEK